MYQFVTDAGYSIVALFAVLSLAGTGGTLIVRSSIGSNLFFSFARIFVLAVCLAVSYVAIDVLIGHGSVHAYF